MRKEDLTDF